MSGLLLGPGQRLGRLHHDPGGDRALPECYLYPKYMDVARAP